MLTRVEISNYRGFKSYRMEGLTRVNLLVGKNNSGKTALLEGIQFLASGGDPAVLTEVAERRGEVVLGRTEPSIAVDIAHFFHGHILTQDAEFSFTGSDPGKPVSAKVVAQKNGRAEADDSRAAVAGFYLRLNGPAIPESAERKFRISREGGVELEGPSRFRRLGAMRRIRGPQVRFVGPDSLNTSELAMMWDEVTMSGQEGVVAETLRALQSDLESLHFLTGMLASGYSPSRAGIVVALKAQEIRVPLGSLGDGMRRLMAVATSLAFTKGGFLFVDEIDTGLHFSVMQDMWKLVLKRAIASNVQVLATTHSWDCIEGLSLLCQEAPETASHVSIHKVDRALQHSVAFPGDTIARMVKSDIDPR